MLAAALDQARTEIISAAVESEAENPSAELLARWLERPPAACRSSVSITAGPVVTAVRLGTDERRDRHRPPRGPARHAVPARPALPHPRAEGAPTSELIAEELRRLDADEMYAVALRGEATKETPAHV